MVHHADEARWSSCGTDQVVVGKIVLIGKESNRLEERSRGEVTAEDLDQRITPYDDHDEWNRNVVPALRAMGAKRIASKVGVSERRARDLLSGKARPRPTTWLRIVSAL